MANLAQMYGYDTNWKPGGSLGGFLASQRENELELARLMEMYNSAQQLQKQKQDYNYNEQMNPLNIQGKGLANTTAQQSIDMNLPKQAVALDQYKDPTYVAGERETARLKGQAENTGYQSKIETNKRERVMSLFEKWSAGNTPQAEMLFDIQQFDPSERQMLMQASKDPAAALEIMLDQDAQKAWSKDKVKTTQNNLTNLEIANRNNETRLAVGTTPRPGSNKPEKLSPVQAQVRRLMQALADGEVTQEFYDEQIADLADRELNRGSGQPGVTLQIPPGGESPALTNKPRKPPVAPVTKGQAPKEETPTSGKMSDGTTWNRR